MITVSVGATPTVLGLGMQLLPSPTWHRQRHRLIHTLSKAQIHAAAHTRWVRKVQSQFVSRFGSYGVSKSHPQTRPCHA